ncbi:MAG: Purine nucleoside phosphorylase 1 [Alphaproteobacteria bacterium MarineAlpha5_Bin11]|nr:purine-nucleoside phosphorylase [Pelagibacteraceae bacterium]PPR44567.1 MAG: Purine nucleoside phosphorylase 1 [Alphaproteobacteria bacterium MarineAlpha5_Bin11]PPR50863.1 MAG: Purine nucleoside phosphorylase 1 [Alphaproteobacteria bacterium MarineAlpha5_Bin10]|tara:strand:+ start:5139 stop:5945 length:807 start_codon:yes stop_codon:yes gene_type:complete
MLKSSKIILKKTNNEKYPFGIILGSGIKNFFEKKEIKFSISYKNLPEFPKPTIKGHSGKIVFGSVYKKKIACLYGRSHIYEGHTPNKLANPIRVLKEIGCQTLVITNAAGSLNKKMSSGSLMLISDHINWSGFNPLIGPNDDNYGTRFPDMSDAYNLDLRQKMHKASKIGKIPLYKGVYTMYSGPNFETPAEIKALRVIGGDAVGMSTVPEVIVANHCGIKTVAISLITNFAAGLSKNKLSHEETLREAQKGEKNIVKLIKIFLNLLK